MAANVKDKLTPEGKRFLEAIKEIADLEVRIGFQAGEAEHDGVDLCEIAAYNELGTVHIPSRPFIRDSVDNHMDEISANIAEWCRKIVRGEMQAHEMMMNIGMMQKGLIQQSIAEGGFEPNSPETIRRKGSDMPLVDSGQMRQSVNYLIVQKGTYND